MYTFDNSKNFHHSIQGRFKKIVIGGITFLASVIVPLNGSSHCFSTWTPNQTIERSIRHFDSHEAFINSPKALNLHLNQWLNELDEYSHFENDWDGEGANAILPETIETVKLILDKTPSICNLIQDIYPTPLGSLCVEWKSNKATINAEILRDSIAFYSDRKSDGSDVSDYVRSTGVTPDFLKTLFAEIYKG